MKYLVLKDEHRIKFVVFDGPGYQLTVGSENFNVPYYVRQYQHNQIGTFSINEVVNCLGSSFFTITNSGCNIYVDGEVLPQGISVMQDEQKFKIGNLTMYLIEEEDKSDLEADFYMQMMQMQDQSEEDHWGQLPLQVVDEDDGFCESTECMENWDDDNEVELVS